MQEPTGRSQFQETDIESNALRRVLSRTISRSSQSDPGPPPDGGFTAWTQAVVGHLVVFNTWGFINSFGVFQTYYVSERGFPPSDVSWVGSLQIFLLFFVGTFSGRATDYGLFRVTILAGSLLHLLGMFMISLSTRYWHLVLAQGVCMGLGNGLVFCPTLAVLSTYFTKKRSLAIGITASGSSTGGLIYPVIVQRLLPQIGFPWTVRILGFVMLGLQAIYLSFMKPRLPPRKSGPLVEWRAFKELSYTLFTIGG
jgi:MFS family permease